ncbi:MAG: ATP-grasp domain-containing protein, partial [Saprospiraceae bacterium]
MNLHEYQAKELIHSYGVPIQKGIMAGSVEDAVAAYKEIRKESNSDIAI